MSAFLRVTKCIVTGAGTSEVNGVYRQADNEIPFMYIKQGKDDDSGDFGLDPIDIGDDKNGWFISFVPKGRRPPGTNTDTIDYYYAPAETTKDCPPSNGWSENLRNMKGLYPATTVFCPTKERNSKTSSGIDITANCQQYSPRGGSTNYLEPTRTKLSSHSQCQGPLPSPTNHTDANSMPQNALVSSCTTEQKPLTQQIPVQQQIESLLQQTGQLIKDSFIVNNQSLEDEKEDLTKKNK